MNLYNKFLIFALYLSALTDGVRKVGAGGISGLGMLTVILSFGSWALALSRVHLPKRVLSLLNLLLFIVVTVISWIIHFTSVPPITVIQNLAVYLGFIGFILVSTIQTYRTGNIPEFISKHLNRSIQISVIIYGLSLAMSGPGAGNIMGARSFGLYATIGTAWFLAKARCGLPGAKLWTWITIGAIALSYSRTSLIVVIILFPLSQLSFNSVKSWVRFAISIILIGTIAFLALNYVEPIRSRFNEQGDNATVGGVKVNTSGRGAAWPVAYASALESPWIGHGPGSIGKILTERVGPAFAHPHNDYLRIFHDFGLIGLGFWLVGYFGLVGKTWQNWQWAEKHKLAHAHIHLAAFLGLIAVAIAMIGDNIVVYIFCMSPMGTLIGASIGTSSISRKLVKSAHKLPISSRESLIIKE